MLIQIEALQHKQNRKSPLIDPKDYVKTKGFKISESDSEIFATEAEAVRAINKKGYGVINRISHNLSEVFVPASIGYDHQVKLIRFIKDNWLEFKERYSLLNKKDVWTSIASLMKVYAQIGGFEYKENTNLKLLIFKQSVIPHIEFYLKNLEI